MNDSAKPFRSGWLPARQKMQTRAGTLGYVVSGEGAATIVLLNGAGVTLERWRAMYPAIERIGRAHQLQLTRLSPLGQQVIASRSGHFPQLAEPGLVLRVLGQLAERAASHTAARA